jgi:hypothetical protein
MVGICGPGASQYAGNRRTTRGSKTNAARVVAFGVRLVQASRRCTPPTLWIGGLMSPRTVLLVVIVLAAPVAAQVASDVPRFEVAPHGDGVTRLDTRSGAVSRCASRDGNWSCEPLAVDTNAADADRGSDVGRALEALSALSARLDSLTARVDALTAPVQASGPVQAQPPRGSLAAEVVSRFVEMVRRLRHHSQG